MSNNQILMLILSKIRTYFISKQYPSRNKLGEISILTTSDLIYHIQGVPKKTLLRDMCEFLTLKMVPLALALIKTKNLTIAIFMTHRSKIALFQWKILSRHQKL